MARARKAKITDEMAQTPISAMIDVVFLLIIFFVVTAAIDKDVEDEKVLLANAPHGKPVKEKDSRSVIINVRQDGTLTMGLFVVTVPQISEILKETADKFNTTDIPIIIRGDRNAQHYYIHQVMDAVTNTGLYRVKFNAVMQ